MLSWPASLTALARTTPSCPAGPREESLPGPSLLRWMPCWQPRKKICWLAREAADVPSVKHPANVGEVAAALKYRYADFSHYNLKDPLDELLFIICSTKTDEANYRASFEALKAAFPTPNQLAQATAEYIAKPIAIGGAVKPEIKSHPHIAGCGCGALWCAYPGTAARNERSGCRGFSDSAAERREKSSAVRDDVCPRPQGFPGGHALLANRSTFGLGQADTKRPVLRATRHGPPSIQNSPGVSLFATREHDFAGARDLHRERTEM